MFLFRLKNLVRRNGGFHVAAFVLTFLLLQTQFFLRWDPDRTFSAALQSVSTEGTAPLLSIRAIALSTAILEIDCPLPEEDNSYCSLLLRKEPRPACRDTDFGAHRGGSFSLFLPPRLPILRQGGATTLFAVIPPLLTLRC